jgi:AmiR/NasT family two-component response regulator
VAVVVALGTLATACLVNDSRLHKQQELVSQLQQALDSRVGVEQAKGMVAEAEGISVGEAFEAIRRYSRDHNMGLRTVADDIVHRGLRP